MTPWFSAAPRRAARRAAPRHTSLRRAASRFAQDMPPHIHTASPPSGYYQANAGAIRCDACPAGKLARGSLSPPTPSNPRLPAASDHAPQHAPHATRPTPHAPHFTPQALSLLPPASTPVTSAWRVATAHPATARLARTAKAAITSPRPARRAASCAPRAPQQTRLRRGLASRVLAVHFRLLARAHVLSAVGWTTANVASRSRHWAH